MGRLLVYVLVIALIGVGLYTTYPVWREAAAPYAEQVGFTLPPVLGDTTPAPAQTAASTPPATSSSTAPSPAPTTPQTPEFATVEELEALKAELASLRQQVASRPAPAVAADAVDADAVDDAIDEKLSPVDTALDQVRRDLATLTDEVTIIRDVLGSGNTGTGTSSGPSPLSADLAQKLQALTDRVSALETQEAPEAVTPEQLAALAARVTGLADAVSASADDAAENRTALADRLAGLDAAISDMNAAVANTRSQSEQAGALLIAANQLSIAAGRSGSFEAELTAVSAVFLPEQEAIQDAVSALADYAGGVPSRTALRDSFSAVGAKILDATVVGGDEGVVGQTLHNIAALITVRRVETDGGDSIDGLVTAAESALRAGDLQAAVDTLGALDGDTADAAAGWLQQAQDRLAVDEAVARVVTAALADAAGG